MVIKEASAAARGGRALAWLAGWEAAGSSPNTGKTAATILSSSL